ncbi:hypothetical protein LTR78_006545 [Recurvomyces mirabilis]|uniref:Peroxidase n=1 Tax=Recurvomyces mirabilis TaxID=574656 RepID=A0AAE1BZV7_9PEZI|nr:hypothetical protein LTR78_006545 [Recurvomyces mirabilis]KAK5151037.1 hypothetical protein LTS14_009532 [Recurvomyces mirabilis]
MLARVTLLAIHVLSAEGALYYPDARTSFLEHILVDNWGAYASNFSSAITPCARYVTQTGDAALKSGRTTAAQWIRVLFHDMITANVTAGTGGVDASIGFETARGEKSGSAFNDSFTFWRPFVNDAVSMADLVALGTVMSDNLCGGRMMQYKAGRVDASSAGLTTGVPAPETDLDTTLLYFERAGFDRADAIGLTACGHTLSSVHHGGIPDVVDATAVTPNNSNGGADFDSTRGVFGPLVVQEYVSWAGQKGGPLVTTSNISTQSDRRLYESDNNATMQALLAQGPDFLDTCVSLMGRAIDTMPYSVNLRSPITPMAIKPVNVTYDFGVDGKLKLSGNIRVLSAAGASSPSSLDLSINGYHASLTAEDSTGSSVFGTTAYFPFSVSSDLIRNAPSFSVSATSFALQGQIFVAPSMTTITGATVNATIASSGHACSSLSIEVHSPNRQGYTLAPKVMQAGGNLTAVAPRIDGCGLCRAVMQLADIPTDSIAVNALVSGGVVDTLFQNGGAVGW